MTRHRDPERIYQAQRAGIFARLKQNERADELDAEHWISRWEREAEANWPGRGSQGYWDADGGGSPRTAGSIEEPHACIPPGGRAASAPRGS